MQIEIIIFPQKYVPVVTEGLRTRKYRIALQTSAKIVKTSLRRKLTQKWKFRRQCSADVCSWMHSCYKSQSKLKSNTDFELVLHLSNFVGGNCIHFHWFESDFEFRFEAHRLPPTG